MDSAELVARSAPAAPGLPIGHVTTSTRCRDLDLLRRLVKTPKVNWIGYSAGTWLGAQYADAFPRHRRPLRLRLRKRRLGSWKRAFDLQPMGFERRFRRDFMRWAAKYDRDFGLGATPGAVLETYENIRSRLTPQTPVDSALVLDHALAGAMYSSQDVRGRRRAAGRTWRRSSRHRAPGNVAAMGAARRRIAADPLLAAPAGVGRGAFGALAGLRAARSPAGRMPMSSDSSDAAFLAITCNDTPWTETRAGPRRELGRARPAVPAARRRHRQRAVRVLAGPEPPPAAADGAGVPPILVVQSAHDPATPLEGARRTGGGAAGVPDAAGHRMRATTGSTPAATPCVDRAVELFVVAGRLPKAGVTCHGKPIPAPGDLARSGAAPSGGLRPDLRPDLRSELRPELRPGGRAGEPAARPPAAARGRPAVVHVPKRRRRRLLRTTATLLNAHRGPGDHRVQQPGRRERDRRDVVAERPAEVRPDRAQRGPGQLDGVRRRVQVGAHQREVGGLDRGVGPGADRRGRGPRRRAPRRR
jgi:hypothetical protein